LHQAQWLFISIRHCQPSSGVFRLDISHPPLIYLTPEQEVVLSSLPCPLRLRWLVCQRIA